MDISLPPPDELSTAYSSRGPSQIADAALDPTVVQRLAEFRARRTQLEIYRGLSLTVIAGILMLLLATCLDGLFNSSAIRWTGSLLTYGCLLTTSLWLVIKPWIAPKSILDDARQVEALEPQLKHVLLSAVELSQESSANRSFSLAFRSELQRQLADEIEPVDVLQLLPWRLVSHFARLASGGLLFAVVLLFIPPLHMPLRFARVLAPMANLGRVSSVAITVQRPVPPDQHVPQGEVLAIAARIDGNLSDDVWLEWRAENGLQRSLMSQLNGFRSRELANESGQAVAGAHYFETTLAVDAEWIDYRITAADATTAWYQIKTSPRPLVEEFEITVRPPDYASTPAKTIQQADGGIDCLKGSTVEVALRTNQLLASAKIRWGGQSVPSDLPLSWEAARDKYVARFQADRDRSYRLALQSAKTGFINGFSRSYQLRCLDDAPPTVRWKIPKPPGTTAEPASILPLAAVTLDELPLGKIELLVRRHDTSAFEPAHLEERRHELQSQSEPNEELPFLQQVELESNWLFDLRGLSLEPGANVQLKVGVWDAKQQYSESETLTLWISSISLDLQPSLAEQLRREVASELTDLASQTATSMAELSTNADQQTDAGQLAQQIKQGLINILPLIIRASASCQNPVDRLELIQLGEWMTGRIATDYAADIQQEVQQLTTAAEHWRALVSFDQSARHGRAIAQLAGSFGNLTSDTQLDVDHLQRQYTVHKKLLEQLQSAILANTDRLHPQSVARRQGNSTLLAEMMSRIDRLQPNSSRDGLQRLATQLSEQLNSMWALSRLDDGLMDNLRQAHRYFEQATDPTDRLITDLANTDLPTTASKDGDDAEIHTADKTKLIQFLSQRRNLHRTAAPGTPHMASMLGYAKRAIQATLQSQVDNQGQLFLEFSRALRVLQLENELKSAASSLDALLEIERWNPTSVSQALDGPRIWQAIIERLDVGLRLSGPIQLPGKLQNQLHDIRHDSLTGRLNTAIRSRLWSSANIMSQAGGLETKRAQLRSIRKSLAPFVREAQQTLIDAAPALPHLARESAERAEQLRSETEELREQYGQSSSEKAKLRTLEPGAISTADSVEARAEEALQPVNDLREAFVDLADTRDLLQQEQINHMRLADAAIGVIDQAKQELVDSLEFLPKEDSETDLSQQRPFNHLSATQRNDLAKASSMQSHAASRLRELAQRLEMSLAVDSDDALKTAWTQLSDLERWLEAEEEKGAFQSPNENELERAEKLAQFARADAEQLMQALEAELNSNPPMQTAMSSLSRGAANDSLQKLRSAYQKQVQLAPRIEESDPVIRIRKQLLTHDLQFVKELVDRDLSMLIGEVRWATGSAREERLVEQLESIQSDLNKVFAGSQIVEASNQTLPKLRQLAGNFRDALYTTTESLQQLQAEVAAKEQMDIHANQGELVNRRRELRDRNRRIHQQDLRHWQRAERMDQQKLEEAEQAKRKSELQLASAQGKLQNQVRTYEQNPDDVPLRTQVQVAEVELRQLQKAASSISRQIKDLQTRQADSKQFVQKVRKDADPDLKLPNPSAKLSSLLALQASERSLHLRQRLAEWSELRMDEIIASAEALAESAKSQLAIESNVREAAENIARASRHENRLENTAASKSLDELATEMQRIADQTLAAAAEQMEAAGRQAATLSSPTVESSGKLAATAAKAAESAGDALQEQVDKLSRFLNATGSQAERQRDDQPEGVEQAAGPKASPLTTDKGQPNSPMNADTQSAKAQSSDTQSNSLPDISELELDAAELAQLLDAVDRQLHPPKTAEREEENNGTGQGKSTSRPQPPATLSQAADRLAEQLSRNRQTESSSANPSMGMAAQSREADVSPRAASIHLRIDANSDLSSRPSDDWAELRDRRAEDASVSASEQVLPRYREQVEAYFRNLADGPTDLRNSNINDRQP